MQKYEPANNKTMTKKHLLTLSILILSVITTFGQFEKYSSYDELLSLAGEYSKKNSIDSSIMALEYAFKKFPKEEEKTTTILGYLYTRTGNVSKAIEIWKSGLEKGYFYGLNHEAYEKNYKDNSDFAKLAEIEKNRENASHVEYEVALPTDYNNKNPYPILFIFHGNTRNIDQAKKTWTSQLMKDKCISVFVQSYAHYNSIGYIWISNDDKTKNEFKEIYDNVMSAYSVDTNKIIFAGMSAGGKIVLDFAFNELVPMSGIILNCPVVPDSISEYSINQFVDKNKMIGIITGEKDFALNDQKELISKINSQEGLNKITINKDIGHTFAEDFSDLLNEYLKWVLE